MDYLYSVQADTVFTVVVTLGVFISGLIFKLAYDNYSQRKYLKSRSKFFIDSAKSLIDPINKQIDCYKKLTDSIKDRKNHRFTYFIVPELNFFFFSTDIIADLHIYNHKRFFKKIKHDSIKNISKSINTIERELLNSMYNLEKLVDKHHELSIEWKKATDSIFGYYDSLIQYRAINKISDKDIFLDRFYNILNDFITDRDDSDLGLTKEKLLMPLRKMCNDIKNDSRVLQIIPSINECLNIFQSIEQNRDHYYEIFSDDCEQLAKTLNNYKTAIQDLEILIK